MQELKPLYSVYISPFAVELRTFEDKDHGDSRLICSQSSYRQALDFSIALAKDKGNLFRNFVVSEK